MKKEAHPAPLPARPSGSTYEMTDDVKSLGGSHPPSLSSRQGSPTEKTPRPPSMRRSSDVPAISLSEPALEDSGPAQGKAKRPSSSADLILPLLIYSVVQSNPNQLASHLAFIQRFRADSLVRGEAAYCLVNMQAVMEFLLTVDLEALGLNAASILPPETVAASPELARVPANVRDKVSQELDSIAGHVGNTISGVAGVMSALLSRTAASPSSPKTIDEVRSVLSGSPQSPESKGAFGANLLKRASNPLNKTTDSIRSRSRSLFGGQPEETKEKELLDVAAPQVEHGASNDSDTKPSIANRLASFARFGTPEVAKDAPVSGKVADRPRVDSHGSRRQHSSTASRPLHPFDPALARRPLAPGRRPPARSPSSRPSSKLRICLWNDF
jgi:phosphopantothenoylcysteine decarboxylase